jgi:hypothetical protein
LTIERLHASLMQARTICVHPPSSALKSFSGWFLCRLLVTKETKSSNATQSTAAHAVAAAARTSVAGPSSLFFGALSFATQP